MLRSRILYLVFLLGALLFYILIPDYISFLVLLVALLLPIPLLLCVLAAGRRLSVTQGSPPAAVSRGEELLFHLKLYGASIFPLSRVRVTVLIKNNLAAEPTRESFLSPYTPRAVQTLSFPVASRYCGQITLTVAEVKLYDPFRLFTRRKRPGLSVSALVLPAVQPLNTAVDLSVDADVDSDLFSTTKSGEDLSEVFGIREYRPGDRLRSIHWKLSSKKDQLLVREGSLPLSNSILFLVELGALEEGQPLPAERLDALMEAAASLSMLLAEHQLAHSFSWLDARQGELARFDVASPADYPLLVPQLLSAGLPQAEAPSLAEYTQRAERLHWAHVIYLTASFGAEGLALLTGLARQPRCTLLYAAGGAPTGAQEKRLEECSAMGVQTACFTRENLQDRLDGLVL